MAKNPRKLSQVTEATEIKPDASLLGINDGKSARIPVALITEKIEAMENKIAEQNLVLG